MKLIRSLLEELSPNTYFRVEDHMPAWFPAGYKRTNASFGSSRISRMSYKEGELEPGDEIHSLQGGLFAIQDSRSTQIRLQGPSDIMPFERGPNPQAERSGWLKRLLQDGKITQIDRDDAISVKYRG